MQTLYCLQVQTVVYVNSCSAIQTLSFKLKAWPVLRRTFLATRKFLSKQLIIWILLIEGIEIGERTWRYVFQLPWMMLRFPPNLREQTVRHLSWSWQNGPCHSIGLVVWAAAVSTGVNILTKHSWTKPTVKIYIAFVFGWRKTFSVSTFVWLQLRSYRITFEGGAHSKSYNWSTQTPCFSWLCDCQGSTFFFKFPYRFCPIALKKSNEGSGSLWLHSISSDPYPPP